MTRCHLMVGLTSVCQESSQRRYQFTIFRYSVRRVAQATATRGLIEEVNRITVSGERVFLVI